MADKRYLGNIITDSPTEPSSDLANSSAKGVWSLAEQLAYQKAGLWPVPGKFPLDIDDVFSTYLYTGNGSARTITNGIDLSGEGGLVWIKNRDTGSYNNHNLYDTENGANKFLRTNGTNAMNTASGFGLTAFNTDGFDMGIAYGNESGKDTASWTFRKAPKFFDVVTYTGDGVAGREIAHNLGSVPGCFILKATSTAGDWIVYHRGLSDPSNKALGLHLTNAEFDNTYFNDTDPTATHFVVGGQGLGINNSGVTYVAYLFAHNDGDGGFGPDADQDIIKCGSYLNNNTAPVYVDLGWEPQWVLVRNITDASPWTIQDSIRGIVANENNNHTKKLEANSTAAETEIRAIQPTPTGFYVPNSIDGAYNSGNAAGTRTHIYIAIRRGPLAVPEDATEVFEPAITYDEQNDPGYNSGFVTDMLWYRHPGNQYVSNDEMRVITRLTQGKTLRTDSSASETGNTSSFDWMDGADAPVNADYKGWLWKRAPGFFDVVTYTGNGTAGRTISHNLGVTPEMIWVKSRSNARQWKTYDSYNGATGRMDLDDDGPWGASSSYWNDTAPTDSVFTLGNQYDVNAAVGYTYIAYLFASAPGVSMVSSYTGNGSSQTIDCGFTAGARFILVKRADSTGDWYVWDTERGIGAGNDPHLSLNTTAAQVTTDDSIDPASSGFIVNQVSATNINVSSAEYIFYAIA